MRTFARHLTREVLTSTALVFGALLALFALLDLLRELGLLGFRNYRVSHILLYVLFSVPGHIYELFPIAVLIGAVFALSQLAAHSEYAVMRASGVSPARMVLALGQAGFVLAVLAFLFGEFIAPHSERLAQEVRLRAMSSIVAQQFRSGLWLKDEGSFINVQQVLPDTTLVGVRIFEFDREHRLRSISFAQRGAFQGGNRWRLEEVAQTRFDGDRASVATLAVAEWRSVLNPDILSVLLVDPQQMSAANLASYVRYLAENRQRTLRYEIALWTKFVYPLAVIVMMVLALPFASLQRRTGGIGLRIFGGIMLGLAFHLANRLFGHVGLLNDWPAAFSAVTPTAAFLLVAMALLWRVEKR